MKRTGTIGLFTVCILFALTSKIAAQTVIEREVVMDTTIDENGKQIINKTIKVKAANPENMADSIRSVEVKINDDNERIIIINGKQVDDFDGKKMIKVRVEKDEEEILGEERTFEIEMDVEKGEDEIIIINGEKIDLGSTEMEPKIIEGGKFLWIEDGIAEGMEEVKEKIYQIKMMVEDEDFQEMVKDKAEIAKLKAEEIAKLVEGKFKDVHFELKSKEKGTLIERELIRDRFIQEGESYLLKLSADKMQINGEKQSKSIALKYAELYKKQTGITLEGKSSVTIEENK